MTHEELRNLADLLREVLVMNPIKRKSAREIAQHCWLSGGSRDKVLEVIRQNMDGEFRPIFKIQN